MAVLIFLVTNGKELVEAALNHRPQLIVTDRDMPIMNGVDAVQKIREIYQPHVVFVTARPPEGETTFTKAELPECWDKAVKQLKLLLKK